jgi:hypothetical protein
MPIDPRIAMGFQPTTQLESPLNRLAKFQQIESGQRANELANMQMQEYQRGLQEQEGLRNYLAGVSDINHQVCPLERLGMVRQELALPKQWLKEQANKPSCGKPKQKLNLLNLT